MITVYGGTGFVGSTFCNMYEDTLVMPRDQRNPVTDNILYLISTIDNYNIHTDITLDVETNLRVLCEVLDHCRKDSIVFNFVSSWFVYGDSRLPAKESYECHPQGFYSITKKCAEDLLISFCRTYEVDYRIMRLCNVMGKGDGKSSAKKNALSFMIDKMKRDEDIDVYDEGTPIRDVMHVKDVCRALRLVMDKGNLNEIYNIGSGQPTRIGDIISVAKQYLNSKSRVGSKEAPRFHQICQTKNMYLDVAKLNDLGFEQEIPLQKIIEELCTN
tara:strand:+ start:320 stop:1135 length:816 start_codon:yes stop_codon:yes gene_type:complete